MLTVLLTAVAGYGLTQLGFKTSQDALIEPSSEAFRDNVRYQAAFGGEAMVVVLEGDVRELFTADNLGVLTSLESELRETDGVATVLGPISMLQYAQAQLGAAQQLIPPALQRLEPEQAAQVQAASAAELARFGEVGVPGVSNPKFIEFLLFDASGEVRSGLGSAFPDDRHAVLVVRLDGNLAIADQAAASTRIKELVASHPLDGFTGFATGSPVLLKEINDYLEGGMARLGLVAVLVMVVLLALVFRVRSRLLPLAVVALGTVWAFGAVGLLGIPLSMVTISGLPIFIGLGVDFAIQMHNRFEEEVTDGRSATEAAARSMRYMAPPLVVAMLAAVAGFLALELSSVPMIRDFGLMLAVGVVALVATAILLPIAALVRRERREPTTPRQYRPNAIERGVRQLTRMPQGAVVPALAIGLLIAAGGFVAEGRMSIQTDPEKWVSQSSDVVAELHQLREETGLTSTLDLLVEAPDVTSDEVVAWMHRFGTEMAERHPDAILGAASMPSVAAGLTGAPPIGSEVDALLRIAPPDIANSLVNPDRTSANMILSIADVTLAERADLVDAVRAELAGDLAPPAGVRATPSGLAVIGTELVEGMEANRGSLSLLSLAFVLGWLLLRFRSLTRSLLPLVPVLIALGASTLAVHLLGIELTPLTTVAAPLVIAVATEFAVLIEARYVEERRFGAPPARAIEYGLTRIGGAFVASGLTLLGGFAVLAFSAMPLLRDFGVVVAVDVAIALLSCLVVLPPLLAWADRKQWVRGFDPGAPDQQEDDPLGDLLVRRGIEVDVRDDDRVTT